MNYKTKVNENLKKIWDRHEFFLIFCILLILSFVTFGNALNSEFLIDDNPMIKNNYSMDTMKFLQLDLHDLRYQAYFRPIMHYMNFITFSFFGPNPAGYHLTNLIIFFLSCITLYYLFSAVFKDKTIALIVSVLFCVHPINGLLVNYKNSTGFSLMVLATNLSIWDFLIAEKESPGRVKRLFSVIWFIIALLCHELVIAYPLYLASILFFAKRYNIRKIFIKIVPFLTVILLYVVFRYSIASLKVLSNARFFNYSFLEYLGGLTKLFSWYLSNLILPHNIVLMYSVIPSKINIFLWSSIFIAAIVMFFALVYKNRKDPKIMMAFAWLAIGFLPVFLGCFSRPSKGFIIEPHWLIFSSIGFFSLAAFFLRYITNAFNPRVFNVLLICILTVLILSSRHYNYLWQTQKRYCMYWLKVDPDSQLANFWFKKSYIHEGVDDE